jgi:hypothetical protein
LTSLASVNNATRHQHAYQVRGVMCIRDSRADGGRHDTSGVLQ